MNTIARKISGSILIASLFLAPAFALADRGSEKDDDRGGRDAENAQSRPSLDSSFFFSFHKGRGNDGTDRGCRGASIGDDGERRCRIATTTDVTRPSVGGVRALPDAASAEIRWKTNEPSSSMVFFGTTSPLDMSASSTRLASDAGLVKKHTLPLSGLAPDTTYHYVVRSIDAAGNVSILGEFSFVTAATSTPTTP